MEQQDFDFGTAHPALSSIPLQLDSLLARLSADVWDTAAWEELLQRVRRLPADDARPHYERFFKLFPLAAKYWQQFAEHERQGGGGDTAKAEAVLGRCLMSCLDADLWRYYVSVVEDAKLRPAQARVDAAAATGPAGEEGAFATEALAAARRDVAQAFDFALSHVGAAFSSGPLWEAFLRFLAAAPEASAYETSAKRDALRRAYQRAVVVPHAACEALWEQYSQWETANTPPALAAALLGTHSSGAGTGRTVFGERKALWAGLAGPGQLLPTPPAGPGAPASRLSSQARVDEQAARWRRVLAYELSNPLRLERGAHAGVVRLHFKQAQAALRWHADAAFDWACFERDFAAAPAGGASETGAAEGGDPDLAWGVLRGALDLLPNCLSLTVAASEFAETHPQRRMAAEANDVWEELIRQLSKLAAPPPPQQPPSSQLALVDALPPGALAPSTLAPTAQDAADAAVTLPLAFILHQRTARRTRGVPGARAVFAAARKSAHVSPPVFLASAQLEYYANFAHGAGREAEEFRGIARNTLEAGRKRFPGDVAYLCSAADALVEWENATNVRAFLEAAIEGLPPGDSRPLWDRYIDYELRLAPGGGSLAAVSALEARRAVAHPHLLSSDSRGLCRLLPHAMAFGSLPAGGPDTDLVRRHPFSPFALLFSPASAAGAPAPSYTSPASLVVGALGDAALASRHPRDGLYPQTAPHCSGPLSHVPPRYWMPALGELTTAAVEGAKRAAAAAAEGVSGAASNRTAEPTAPAAQSASVSGPSSSPIPLPKAFRGLMARLPAFDEELEGAPAPGAEELLRRLGTRLVSDGGDGGAPGSGGEAPGQLPLWLSMAAAAAGGGRGAGAALSRKRPLEQQPQGGAGGAVMPGHHMGQLLPLQQQQQLLGAAVPGGLMLPQQLGGNLLHSRPAISVDPFGRPMVSQQGQGGAMGGGAGAAGRRVPLPDQGSIFNMAAGPVMPAMGMADKPHYAGGGGGRGRGAKRM